MCKSCRDQEPNLPLKKKKNEQRAEQEEAERHRKKKKNAKEWWKKYKFPVHPVYLFSQMRNCVYTRHNLFCISGFSFVLSALFFAPDCCWRSLLMVALAKYLAVAAAAAASMPWWRMRLVASCVPRRKAKQMNALWGASRRRCWCCHRKLNKRFLHPLQMVYSCLKRIGKAFHVVAWVSRSRRRHLSPPVRFLRDVNVCVWLVLIIAFYYYHGAAAFHLSLSHSHWNANNTKKNVSQHGICEYICLCVL